jgi:hypothetical protein
LRVLKDFLLLRKAHHDYAHVHDYARVHDYVNVHGYGYDCDFIHVSTFWGQLIIYVLSLSVTFNEEDVPFVVIRV